VSWLLETFAALTSAPFASEGAYVHRLVKTVLALGSHGECVIVGRGAAFILPATMTLRVRLIAPREERVATIREQLGVPQQKAAREVETMDREHKSFIEDHFFKDPADPRNYDLVLNSARLSVVGCAELIVAALGFLKPPPSR
jgi:cytidylate kinase